MTKSRQITFFLWLLCTLALAASADAQNEQDCFGAIPVCNGFYDQQESYSGTGSIDNELPGGFNDCLSIDANSVWYTFTVESDGDLSFILTPNSPNADYDWMVFDFSSGNCDEISTNSDLIVSCNSYGNIGANGPTGISTAMGGTGNSNGPGNTNGPIFNQDLPVLAGETYLLYIQDWSGSTEGYTLDFTVSTASIFDEQAPEITTVTAQCNGDLIIEFSENIDCANIELSDFNINTENGNIGPNSLVSNCSTNSSSTDYVTLSFLPTPDLSLPLGEDMTLEIQNENGLLSDLCGNVIEDLTFDFSTAAGIEFQTEISNAECGLANGEINVVDIIGGTEPLTYSLDGSSQTSPLFNNLQAGTYTITVTDDLGCFSSSEAMVNEVSALEVNAGSDGQSCDLTFQLSGSVSDNGVTEWSSADGLTFSNVNDLGATVTASEAGTYTLLLTSDQNGCESTDEVEVSLSSIETTFDNLLTACSENCSGEINVTTTNGVGAYSHLLNGTNQGASSSFQNLCPGSYTLEIADAIGCTVTEEFIITELSSPELLSSEVIDVTCEDGCNGAVILSVSDEFSVTSPGATYDPATESFSDLCAGSFTYVLTSADNCTSTFSETIVTLSTLNAALSVTPNPVDINDPIVELSNLSSGDPISSEFSIVSETESNFTLGPEIDFSGHEGSPVTIQLVVEDVYGCIDSQDYVIEFITPLVVFVPNAFSPNNDGLNEGFIPVASGLDIDDYEFIIFDRWGNELFSSIDSTEPWLGNVTGGDYYVPPGTYTYSLKVKQRFLPNYKEFYGSIQVVR